MSFYSNRKRVALISVSALRNTLLKTFFGRFFTRLLGRGKKSGKVVTSYEYQGDKRSEALYQNLTIQGALPLNYHISVEVEDLNTGKKAVMEKVVVLRELDL